MLDNIDIHQIKVVENAPQSGAKNMFLTKNKKLKIILIPLGILLIFILIMFLAVGLPAMEVYSKAQKLALKAKSMKAVFDTQDIGEIRKNLTDIANDLSGLQGSYKKLFLLKSAPVISSYLSDGDSVMKAGSYAIEAAQITLDTIEPYSDIIGLKGTGGHKAKSGEENANDRVEFVIKTIGEIAPKLDLIAEKARLAKSELDKIKVDKYPETFRGIKIRENLNTLFSLVGEGTKLLNDGKPLIESAPYLLGIDSPRTYLVLFQNDKELRPTGGFITAYSVMRVDKGKIQPVISNDIYNLDSKYIPEIAAPDPIIRYIKGPYILSKNLRLRDMNFSPDFKVSMDTFTKEVSKVGIKNIDGVIAVDTQLLVKLLDVIGEIGVPGFGNFGTKIVPECNCPQVIHELESFADVEGPIIWDPVTGKIILKPAHADNRKEIVGPLMNSVLRNALGQPKNKLPDLFRVGFESLTEKHVLFYLFNEKAQKGAEAFNIAGRIQDYAGDYLNINDANLGGRKSNLYVTQEVNQEINVGKDGRVEKTVTITYKNPQSYDGWLNSVLPNWSRIYVPKGSELISTDGFEDKGKPYEEFGKTVFSGGFKLRPQGVVQITIKYKLPAGVDKNYSLLIQKQPGTDSPSYIISHGSKKVEFYLKTDKELKFSL